MDSALICLDQLLGVSLAGLLGGTMASIFGGHFVENLRRLYASAGAVPREAPQDFTEFLVEAQKASPPAVIAPIREVEALKLDESIVRVSATDAIRADEAPPLYLREGELRSQPLRPQAVESAKVPSAPVAPATQHNTPVIREAVRERVPFLGTLEGVSADSDPRAHLELIISRAGEYHGVDPDLSLAVAHAESGLRPDAISRDGFRSKGIFQLLDSTAAEMMKRMEWKSGYDPFDPATNSHLGVGYLRRLHELFAAESDLGFNIKTVPVSSAREREKLAVAAFNAGEGRVARAQQRAAELGRDPSDYDAIAPFLPHSTRNYVARVFNLREQFALRRDHSTIV